MAALAACGSAGPETTPTPSGTATPSATASETVGPLDVALTLDSRLPSRGFVADLGDRVVLLSRSGGVSGHVPGATLDRDLTEALAIPVLVLEDGSRVYVTSAGFVAAGGEVDLGAPIGNDLVIDGTTLTFTKSGTVAVAAPIDDVVVGVVHNLVTVSGPESNLLYRVGDFDPIDIDPACAAVDVHFEANPLLVCDDGEISVLTDFDRPADQPFIAFEVPLRIRWATVGMTGSEALAVLETPCGLDGVELDLELGERSLLTPNDAAGLTVPLSWTASGGLWAAATDVACDGTRHPEPGIWERDAAGSWARLGPPLPGLVDAAVWFS